MAGATIGECGGGLDAGVAKALGVAGGGVEGVGFLPGDLFVAGDDDLGDAFAALDAEGVFAVVDEEDLEFAAVVGVDGAG